MPNHLLFAMITRKHLLDLEQRITELEKHEI